MKLRCMMYQILKLLSVVGFGLFNKTPPPSLLCPGLLSSLTEAWSFCLIGPAWCLLFQQQQLEDLQLEEDAGALWTYFLLGLGD